MYEQTGGILGGFNGLQGNSNGINLFSGSGYNFGSRFGGLN